MSPTYCFTAPPASSATRKRGGRSSGKQCNTSWSSSSSQSSTSRSSGGRGSDAPKLCPVSPSSVAQWPGTHPLEKGRLKYYDSREDGFDALNVEHQPAELDDSWPYIFHTGDRVWARMPDGDWRSGTVVAATRCGPTRQKEGLHFGVVFDGSKKPRFFAPLNGELKADTPHIRQLLEDSGLLD